MDALTLLSNDHRTVDALLERCLGGSCSRELFEEISRELSIHAAIEETQLYPAIRDGVPLTDHLIDHALEEHQTVKNLLAELDDLTPGAPEFAAGLRKLAESVREHVAEEEGKLFAMLRDRFPAHELEELGERLERAKRTAPTRPHPSAPNQPPANKVAGAAAAVVDRVRDKLEGR